MNSPDRLLHPNEVARRLGVSRTTPYHWFWEGKLKGVKLGEEPQAPVRIYESSVKERENLFADEHEGLCESDRRLCLVAYARMQVAWG
ncbi:MAG: helix-turn-helix domain-containing protein [Candidatus Micrarchaeia archaeon]